MTVLLRKIAVCTIALQRVKTIHPGYPLSRTAGVFRSFTHTKCFHADNDTSAIFKLTAGTDGTSSKLEQTLHPTHGWPPFPMVRKRNGTSVLDLNLFLHNRLKVLPQLCLCFWGFGGKVAKESKKRVVLSTFTCSQTNSLYLQRQPKILRRWGRTPVTVSPAPHKPQTRGGMGHTHFTSFLLSSSP